MQQITSPLIHPRRCGKTYYQIATRDNSAQLNRAGEDATRSSPPPNACRTPPTTNAASLVVAAAPQRQPLFYQPLTARRSQMRIDFSRLRTNRPLLQKSPQPTCGRGLGQIHLPVKLATPCCPYRRHAKHVNGRISWLPSKLPLPFAKSVLIRLSGVALPLTPPCRARTKRACRARAPS
jgi:hypothetical protein